MLRIGFIGHGSIAGAHAAALSRLRTFRSAPTFELAVLCGRDSARLRADANQLGFERTTTDWDEMLDEVDIVYVLTPDDAHATPAVEALSRNLPTFCEKPLAGTLTESSRMAEAAAAADAVTACGFVYRFIPAVQLAHRLIDSGEIGELREVRATYLQNWCRSEAVPWQWRHSEEHAAGGALGDLGVHLIDLVHFLVGEIATVDGHLETFVGEREPDADSDPRPVTADDSFRAYLRFQNGAIGTLDGSRVATGHENDLSIEITGSKGSIWFSLDDLNTLVVHRPNEGSNHVQVSDMDHPFIEKWWPPGHRLGWEHAFAIENYQFLASVEDGAPFDPDFQAGHEAQRIIDAVKRSYTDRNQVSPT